MIPDVINSFFFFAKINFNNFSNKDIKEKETNKHFELYVNA